MRVMEGEVLRQAGGDGGTLNAASLRLWDDISGPLTSFFN